VARVNRLVLIGFLQWRQLLKGADIEPGIVATSPGSLDALPITKIID
jgi:hypothetical protein